MNRQFINGQVGTAFVLRLGDGPEDPTRTLPNKKHLPIHQPTINEFFYYLLHNRFKMGMPMSLDIWASHPSPRGSWFFWKGIKTSAYDSWIDPGSTNEMSKAFSKSHPKFCQKRPLIDSGAPQSWPGTSHRSTQSSPKLLWSLSQFTKACQTMYKKCELLSHANMKRHLCGFWVCLRRCSSSEKWPGVRWILTTNKIKKSRKRRGRKTIVIWLASSCATSVSSSSTTKTCLENQWMSVGYPWVLTPYR